MRGAHLIAYLGHAYNLNKQNPNHQKLNGFFVRLEPPMVCARQNMDRIPCKPSCNGGNPRDPRGKKHLEEFMEKKSGKV